MSSLELFGAEEHGIVPLGDGIALLRGFADTPELMPLIEGVAARAPFRHLVTPGSRVRSFLRGLRSHRL
jgi:alkylated DNA repair protein (DNA oxidative demethylase)